jgi:hypothetical protein
MFLTNACHEDGVLEASSNHGQRDRNMIRTMPQNLRRHRNQGLMTMATQPAGVGNHRRQLAGRGAKACGFGAATTERALAAGLNTRSAANARPFAPGLATSRATTKIRAPRLRGGHRRPFRNRAHSDIWPAPPSLRVAAYITWHAAHSPI